MTLEEFKMLDNTQQILHFFGGVAVGKVERDGMLTECKKIDDFYVAYTIKLADHFQLGMECHNDVRVLEKYLSNNGMNQQPV